jgi:hypothetical protein
MGTLSLGQKQTLRKKIFPTRVYLEILDFGSGRGRSDFETVGVAALRQGFQNRENEGWAKL